MLRLNIPPAYREGTAATQISWKPMLAAVWRAAKRVHHYRDVHTGMMREALGRLDCGRQWRECGSE